MTHTLHLIGNTAPLIFAAIFLIVERIKTRQAKRAQQRLIDAAEAAKPWHPWFRVMLARPAHFNRWLKWVPFEAKGILVFASDHVSLLAEMPSGEKLDLNVPRDQWNIEWIGSDGIRSGHRFWFRISYAEHSFYVTADVSALTDLRARQEATVDLCRQLAPGVSPPPPAFPYGYALEKNPAALSVVVAFFVLFFYALIDGFVSNPYELLNEDRVRNLMPFAIIAAVPCYFWLTKREVPTAESGILAVLLAAVTYAATYPAIKRVDQALSDGPHRYEYRLLSNKTLEPVDAELPKLDYSFRPEYWAQFDVGSIHTFELIHGPIGLWQLDRRPLRNAMRDFYEK